MEYAKFAKPHIGKSAISKDKAGQYVKRVGETMGEVRLVRDWFALGKEVSINTNQPMHFFF